MSRFLTAAQFTQSVAALRDDERATVRWHRVQPSDVGLHDIPNGLLWSGSKLSDGLVERLILEVAEGYEIAPADATRGASTGFKITGVTRDSTGTPLGSCVIQGFLTATDVLVGEQTSDASGYFEFITNFPAPAQHYLVAYKAGSPDVTGASVNTLTAS